jgi:hypothetical protein
MNANFPTRLLLILAIMGMGYSVQAQSVYTLQDFQNTDPSIRMSAFYALIQPGVQLDDTTRVALFNLLITETAFIEAQDQLNVDNEDDAYAEYYSQLVDVIASLRDIRSLGGLAELVQSGSIVTDALASFGAPALDTITALVSSSDPTVTTGAAIVLEKMLSPQNVASVSDPVSLGKIGLALYVASSSPSRFTRQVATDSQATLRTIDTTPPTFNCVPPSADGLWHNTNLSFNCTAQDNIGLTPSSPATFALRTAVPVGTETSNASTGIQPLCDLAINCVTAGPIGGNMIDLKPPTITVTTPVSGATYKADQILSAAYSCTDLGSGVAACVGTVPTGSNVDTAPNGISTPKTFVVNSADKVGNSSSQSVSYTISCHYVGLGVSPTTVSKGSIVMITGDVMSCTPNAQTIREEFSLTGPLGPSCAKTSTVMFTTPPFTIPPGTSKSISFPFLIPKNACAGTYTTTSITLLGGTVIDSSSSTLIVQ